MSAMHINLGTPDKFNRASKEEPAVNMDCENDFHDEEKDLKSCNRKCYSNMFTIQDPIEIGKLFKNCEVQHNFSIADYGQKLKVKIGDEEVNLKIE